MALMKRLTTTATATSASTMSSTYGVAAAVVT